jgi:hypothetical protein
MDQYGTSATEEQQAQFFYRLRDGFRAACARTGEIVRDFRVAGTSVRLRFAGDALVPYITPGLAFPVDRAPAGSGCEVLVWDSRTTCVPLPAPPVPWEDFTARGNIWRFDSPRYRSAYHWGEGSVNVMDREAREAVYWVPSPEGLPSWVIASPLRSILHWWLEQNNRQLVHAAAVGHRNRGVLLPGRGGSGKSSTSLACLMAGMDFIADDYLALSLDPEPRAYRLYTTAKLDEKSLALYPKLTSGCRVVLQPGFEKAVLFFESAFRDQLKESLPIELVLKPRIAGVPETTLGPIEVHEIEQALASETLAHLPHAGAGTVEFLDRVAREIPRAAIHLGTDRASIAAKICEAVQTQAVEFSSAKRDPRPMISVLVHFRRNDAAELRNLAANLQVQNYPRTELVVTADPAAEALSHEIGALPETVRFFAFDETTGSAAASNRAIRESFAELLVLLEPGDRLAPGALDLLVRTSEEQSTAAWIRSSAAGLRGWLIRKSAFRECGLFTTNPLLQGHEHQEWLRRADRQSLTGAEVDRITLEQVAGSACSSSPAVDLGILKTELDRRRRNLL